MTQQAQQDLADKLTSITLTELYGERFTNLEDVEEDEQLNREWEYLNEKFYDTLSNISSI